LPHLGFGELLVVLAIVMLIFGAGKLPQIGDELGRRIRGASDSPNAADLARLVVLGMAAILAIGLLFTAALRWR